MAPKGSALARTLMSSENAASLLAVRLPAARRFNGLSIGSSVSSPSGGASVASSEISRSAGSKAQKGTRQSNDKDEKSGQKVAKKVKYHAVTDILTSAKQEMEADMMKRSISVLSEGMADDPEFVAQHDHDADN